MKAQNLIIAGAVSLALTRPLGAQPPAVGGPAPVAPGPSGPPAPMIGPGENGLTVSPQPDALPPGAFPPRPLRRRDLSWIYIDRPRPRKVAVHDIITVVVDEKSESTQNSRFNRQRNSIFTAQLREWLRINSNGDLDVAAGNAPGINAQLRSQMQSFGTGLTQEGLKYRIAATIVDILPNGTLILEAHKSIRTDDAIWEYSLTGRIRTQDVAGNNTVLSENIADMNIIRRLHGKIPDSTKRGIITKLYDWFLPF
ncbi:MAG TPA: flagellar basal body L-ring protein FlgH [Planctomycetaceae bacterium]|nr:flagellar basal body L-ring protein FlgH [Planctomycetaceae bacterium]